MTGSPNGPAQSDYATTEPELPRVLFVCVENSCRSQMAEAFANLEGQGRVHAHSGGSRPSGVVNPRAIEVMSELGYDLGAHRSEGLEDLPSGGFAAVVTMGCGDACPHVPADRREDWEIPDPKDLPVDEFRSVRDDIARRVRDLLGEILDSSAPILEVHS